MLSQRNTTSEYFMEFERKNYHDKGEAGLWKVHFKHEDPNFPKVAVLKEFKKLREEYKKEAKHLEDWSKLHPNIVQFYYSVQVGEEFRIFMEYCKCGSLSNIIKEREKKKKPWTDWELVKHFITIADVIKTLHDKDCAHRDIKPDNIFVQPKEELKIGDFGESKEIIIGWNKYTVTGTLVYMSPYCQNLLETLSSDKDGKKKTKESITKPEEVWAVGKTFYEMAVLKIGVPFPNNEEEILKEVENDMKSRPRELVILLKWMLKNKTDERPEILIVLEELKRILENTEQTCSDFSPLTDENSFEIEDVLGSSNQNVEGIRNPHSSERRFFLETDSVSNEIKSKSHKESIFDAETRGIRGVEYLANTDTSNPNCDFCNKKGFFHDCGYEHQKDRLKAYIETSLMIGVEQQDINCLKCSKPFSIEIYLCPIGHFN